MVYHSDNQEKLPVINHQPMSDRLALDLIGIREATDKSSLIGDYLRHYESLFGAMRDDEFNLIEIGVFHGGSARTWERFFSRARIVGVDIDQNCRKYATERVIIEIGSQNDPEFLHHIASTYPPRVIIDDGSHRSYDIIFTFERLFPALQPGGIYVIEDLHFHLVETEAERLRGGSSILAHEYVADLVKDRLGNHAYVNRLEGIRRHLIASIDRIEIIGQAAVFHKKDQKAPPLDMLRSIRPHVEASGNWLNWFVFSQKLMAAGGDPLTVIDALRRSIALDGNIVIAYERLSDTLEQIRDFEGAIKALETAVSIKGVNPDLVISLQNRLRRLRDATAA